LGLIAFFALSFLSLIGLFAVCCSSKAPIIGMVIVATLVMPCFWLFSGAALETAVFTADWCQVKEKFIFNQIGGRKKEFVQYYLVCHGVNPYQNVTTKVYRELQMFERGLNYSISHGASNTTLDKEKFYIEQLKRILHSLSQLGDCQRTSSAWNQSQDLICNQFLFDLTCLLFASILIAIFLLIASCVGVSLKRAFHQRKYEDQNYEDPEYQDLNYDNREYPAMEDSYQDQDQEVVFLLQKK